MLTFNDIYWQFPTPNLEMAVRAGNDYLQIKPTGPMPTIRAVDGEPEDNGPRVQVAQTMESTLATLTKMILQLGEKIEKLENEHKHPVQSRTFGSSGRPPEEQRQPGQCWGCGQPGHFRRDCRTRPWEGTVKQIRKPNPGNGQGPQQ